MVCQSVHHDDKGQDMAAHDEHQEQQLRSPQDFATDTAHHDLAGVTHTVHMGIFQLELTEGIARVCRQGTQAKDQDHRTRSLS